MDKRALHHALKVHTDVCIGCSHCMRVCPTEAIRVRDGKAFIFRDRCIDCGECYRVCPVSAIYVEQDDFNLIYKYKHAVALVPSVLIGQFPDDIRTTQIYNAILDLGFSNVYEVEHGVDFLSDQLNAYLENPDVNKPAISSYCPAIIRLLQVRFPSLVDNIISLRPPLDIAATYIRKKLLAEGANENEVGIFYITPCSAKIASIKSPVGDVSSNIDGVINQSSLYNRIMKQLKKNENKELEPINTQLTEKGILWSLTNGEATHAKGRSLAIDGIENAIDFLEKLENEEVKGIDFIEIRACDESCAGGILNTNNRFLTAERLRTRAKIYRQRELKGDSKKLDMQKSAYNEFVKDELNIGKIQPRQAMQLDDDMAKAIEKMKRTQKMLDFLPGFDCGACGSPSCKALAEDIAQGNATLSYCIFMQRIMEKHHKLSPAHAFGIIEKIWGKDRLDEQKFKKKEE